VDIKPIILTEQFVGQWHIYQDCAKTCVATNNCGRDGAFKLTTSGGYKFARLYLNKNYINFELQELKYLMGMFHVVVNQQIQYTEALSDVMTYVTATLTSSNYVVPGPNASKNILYPQLFEELKTIM
jgi:hypothetical protein